MTCDEFESLLASETIDVRVAGLAHRASCGRCDALHSAFLEIDGALTVHYGRTCAPQTPLATPAAPQISVLPETLDFFGWGRRFCVGGNGRMVFRALGSRPFSTDVGSVHGDAALRCVLRCVLRHPLGFRANEI